MSINRFGYPFEQRIKALADSKPEVVEATWPMEVMGEKRELVKFRVPIELPKYRLANGRTAALQEQHLASSADLPDDFFEKDPELDVVQETQHSLLMQLVREADLQGYFKDKANKQIEPIILDEYGFVVNGNRRLTCWRDLYYSEPSDYPHFSHVDVVVLPHCDEKEIDRIEAALQIKKDIRAKYSWEARAIMMRHKQRQHGFTDTQLAELYDMSEADVRQAREMLDTADTYLKSRQQAHQWQNVSGAEEAFKQLYKAAKKTTSPPEQALLKNAAFALIDVPKEAGERLYSAIPKIQEFLPKVKEKLATAFKVESAPVDDFTQELFGGGPAQTKPDVSYALAAEVVKPENSEQVRALVVEVIEAENELQKERNNAGYLLKMLRDANSKLQAAVSDGLRADSNRAGAAGQIESIETLLETIKDWLAKQDA